MATPFNSNTDLNEFLDFDIVNHEQGSTAVNALVHNDNTVQAQAGQAINMQFPDFSAMHDPVASHSSEQHEGSNNIGHSIHCPEVGINPIDIGAGFSKSLQHAQGAPQQSSAVPQLPQSMQQPGQSNQNHHMVTTPFTPTVPCPIPMTPQDFLQYLSQPGIPQMPQMPQSAIPATLQNCFPQQYVPENFQVQCAMPPPQMPCVVPSMMPQNPSVCCDPASNHNPIPMPSASLPMPWQNPSIQSSPFSQGASTSGFSTPQTAASHTSSLTSQASSSFNYEMSNQSLLSDFITAQTLQSQLEKEHALIERGKQLSCSSIICEQGKEPFSTDDECFDAMQSSRVDADAYFVCCTESTQKFCRPSCPSKRPGRPNVRFIKGQDRVAQALQQGFTPCLRCRPGDIQFDLKVVKALGQCLGILVKEASARIHDPKMERMTLKDYEKYFDISLYHFHRTSKRTLTITLGEFREWCPVLMFLDMIAQNRIHMMFAPQPMDYKQINQLAPNKVRDVLGGISIDTYCNGFPGKDVWRVTVHNTPLMGDVCVLLCPNTDVKLAAPKRKRPSAAQLRKQKEAEKGKAKAKDAPEKGTKTASGRRKATAGREKGKARADAKPVRYQPAILNVFIGANAEQRAIMLAPASRPNSFYQGWLQETTQQMWCEGLRETHIPAEYCELCRRLRLFIKCNYHFQPDRFKAPSDKRVLQLEDDAGETCKEHVEQEAEEAHKEHVEHQEDEAHAAHKEHEGAAMDQDMPESSSNPST